LTELRRGWSGLRSLPVGAEGIAGSRSGTEGKAGAVPRNLQGRTCYRYQGNNSPGLTCLDGSSGEIGVNTPFISQTPEACCWMKTLLAWMELLLSKLVSFLPFEY